MLQQLTHIILLLEKLTDKKLFSILKFTSNPMTRKKHIFLSIFHNPSLVILYKNETYSNRYNHDVCNLNDLWISEKNENVSMLKDVKIYRDPTMTLFMSTFDIPSIVPRSFFENKILFKAHFQNDWINICKINDYLLTKRNIEISPMAFIECCLILKHFKFFIFSQRTSIFITYLFWVYGGRKRKIL